MNKTVGYYWIWLVPWVGYDYDEMWRANALPGIIGSACTTNKEKFFNVG